MRSVEYFRWWVTAPGRKRPYLTSFPMSAEDAKRYPGARPEPSTREVRELPDTPEEQATAHFQYQSAGHDSVQPPRQNAAMPDQPWLSPPVKFSGLRAGRHLYFDHPGQDGQLVDVHYEEGEPIVRFLDTEPEDAEVTLNARDMSGRFERVIGQ